MNISLFGLHPDDLMGLASEWGEPPFRGRQLSRWIHARGVCEPSEMTDIPKALRDNLSHRFPVQHFKTEWRKASSDGSVKYGFRLKDGALIESILIRSRDHRTLCVSTQVGCPLRCSFCASGLAGYERNLDAAEILAQYHVVQRNIGPRGSVRNIVFMGMGEPLLNEEALFRSLDILLDTRGVAMGARRVVVSTVGIVPAIRRLSQRPITPELAISLHAGDEDLRRQLMPIAERYPIASVLEAAEAYMRSTSKSFFTVEYLLLKGVNDGPDEAKSLVRRLAGKPVLLNLIRYNPVESLPFERPTEERVQAFAEACRKGGIKATVRRSAAVDIGGGCGQLRRIMGMAGEETS